MVRVITEYSYVNFSGMLFRQTKGISMGASCSPIIADLVLSKLEFDFLTKPENIGAARRLKFTRRYIDDILSLGTAALRECHKAIYPASLPLNFDAPNNGKVHFLDLDIDVNSGNRSIFDKRREFKFEVINMPFRDSNQPLQIGLSVYFSQLLRFVRICSTEQDLNFNVELLTSTMRARGFNEDELLNTATKLGSLYPRILLRIEGYSKKKLRTAIAGCFRT